MFRMQRNRSTRLSAILLILIAITPFVADGSRSHSDESDGSQHSDLNADYRPITKQYRLIDNLILQALQEVLSEMTDTEMRNEIESDSDYSNCKYHIDILNFNFLESVTAGGPRSPKGHV